MLFEQINLQKCSECGKVATYRILSSHRTGVVPLCTKHFNVWKEKFGDALVNTKQETTPLAPVRSTFNIEPSSMPRTKKQKEDQLLRMGPALLANEIRLANGVENIPVISRKDNFLRNCKAVYKDQLNDRTCLWLNLYNEDQTQTHYRVSYEIKGKRRHLVLEEVRGKKFYRRIADEVIDQLSRCLSGKTGRCVIDNL